MRWGMSYRRSGARTGGSLIPFVSLILLPVIVAILTVAFLGYVLWRLGYLFWQLLCLAWQAVRARRVTDASSRATT